MDVPVVAAARLESHVGDVYLFPRDRCEVTVAGEIFGIRRVGFADGENHFTLECRFCILAGRLFRPYVFRQTECRPCFRPTGIEADMCDDFGDFGAGDAVALRRLQMICQRIVGDALTDERCNRYQAAVAKTELVGAAPYLAEKDIVVEFRKFGCELA